MSGKERPSRYVAVRIHVRWGDCDPAGIAYYPRFFEWMDQASHALARELGVSPDQMLPPASIGFPLVAAQAEFLAPALLEDSLEVRARVARIGRTSFALRHEILRVGDDNVILARGCEERVYVSPGRKGARSPRELTSGMRAVLERYADRAAEPADQN